MSSSSIKKEAIKFSNKVFEKIIPCLESNETQDFIKSDSHDTTGKLSRIFDKMLFSEQDNLKIYNTLSQLGEEQLKDFNKEIVRNLYIKIAPNGQLKDKIKSTIGEPTYTQFCQQLSEEKIIILMVEASIMLLAQVLPAGLKVKYPDNTKITDEDFKEFQKLGFETLKIVNESRDKCEQIIQEFHSDIINSLIKECTNYQRHLARRMERMYSKVAHLMTNHEQEKVPDDNIEKRVEEIAKIDIDSIKSSIKSTSDRNILSVLNKTATKYNNVNRMLEALEEDNGFERRLKRFSFYFKEGKSINGNSNKWKSFAKKIGAILSCVFIVGIYKACTSDTFFGKSHGKVTSQKIDSTLSLADTIT